MKQLIFTLIVVMHFSCANSQQDEIDHKKIREDLSEILNDLSWNYVYLKEKKVDLKCIKDYYTKQIPSIKTEEEKVLFFEYLLDEFYDSHLTLNTNRYSSYRLFSPIYASLENGKAIISSVWQSQLENLKQNILSSEVLKINGIKMEDAIEKFPTHCNDKEDPKVREWIINKILSGRYSEPRILELKSADGKITEFDIDELKIKKASGLLSSRIEDEIGIIRINNTLGNNSLISAFDEALDELKSTKGLIIDLRNTVDGGNTYVARGIMSRFIREPRPYQIHEITEQYDRQPEVVRSWAEYVSPRNEHYEKPVVILVGRWTGSMGEGLAIGFEGMERAQIVGTEMERLAGEMNGFSFKHQNFGYRLSTAKLSHVNGTPREQYVPKNYVRQTTIKRDEVLEKGIEMISNMSR